MVAGYDLKGIVSKLGEEVNKDHGQPGKVSEPLGCRAGRTSSLMTVLLASWNVHERILSSKTPQTKPPEGKDQG